MACDDIAPALEPELLLTLDEVEATLTRLMPVSRAEGDELRGEAERELDDAGPPRL